VSPVRAGQGQGSCRPSEGEREPSSGCGTFQPREKTDGDDVSRDIVAGST
jgi:hypothetical protein